jgi:hypothetical protein
MTQSEGPPRGACADGPEGICLTVNADKASAETLLKTELLPPQHKPAHVKIRQQW